MIKGLRDLISMDEIKKWAEYIVEAGDENLQAGAVYRKPMTYHAAISGIYWAIDELDERYRELIRKDNDDNSTGRL